MLNALRQRVLCLDGAMGTMIQQLNLSEADFRGGEFAAHPCELKGCNDLLNITRPDDILNIHRQYIEAGADIIETNTFNSNAISLADYALQDLDYRLALAGAQLARQAAGSTRFVAGSMGPSNASLALGGNISFEQMAACYERQAAGLIEGGVDILMLETCFDTLNVKAAGLGIERAQRQAGTQLPLWISATLTETGRLLSGQELEAFVISVSHLRPAILGLNCGFGAEGMLPHLERLRNCLCPVSCHPNAGLPNELGQYDQTPQLMLRQVNNILNQGLVNIIGGCCGTTPAHIRLIAQAARQASPRPLTPRAEDSFDLAGLSPMKLQRGEFLKIGERCNVAGSRKFLRLISEGNFTEALQIAADQVKAGAGALDINMDDALLDALPAMTHFVDMLATDPTVAPLPLMIDSSNFDVIEAALMRLQGRPLVNSISLKEGEELFLAHARRVRELGAAVVVMAFDEEGQADTFNRRIDICQRSYNLLTEKAGFRGCEIVFDPNVLAVATGLPTHDRYALDFLKAAQWIVTNLPGARVSGGVSNLSFAFRGNNPLRQAMHALFIEAGRQNGLEMAIMNPSAPIAPTPQMETEMLALINSVLLCTHPDATARLTEYAAKMLPSPNATNAAKATNAAAKPSLADKIIAGTTEGLLPLLDEALLKAGSAMAVIDGELMNAMNRVGELFGQGKLFLPQVVRAADVMRHAVNHLQPLLEAQSANTEGDTIVLATVKGDVHDIGKNIVGIVLRCAGFRVVDLGVMVPVDKILASAIAEKAVAIGLSGLITPSLTEMANVATEMQRSGMNIPLFVGGATTSDLHTAVKLAPLYSAPIMRTADAASLPAAVREILNGEGRAPLAKQQARLREEYTAKAARLPLDQARLHAMDCTGAAPQPTSLGSHTFEPSAHDLMPLINWRALLGEWRIDPSANSPEAQRLLEDARRELASMHFVAKARILIAPMQKMAPEEIEVEGIRLHLPRRCVPMPVTGLCPSLADFTAKHDHIGLFAVSISTPTEAQPDEYRALLRQILSHRLAEAATEWLQQHTLQSLWPAPAAIRPAVGYSSLPDQQLIFTLDKLLHLSDLGITLTSAGAMSPGASTCGLLLPHPAARYF